MEKQLKAYTYIIICLFRREYDALNKSIEANRRKLQTMESSRSNRLRRFGEHMPALLNAIEEAYRKGHFKHKPRGPLGKIEVVQNLPVLMVTVYKGKRPITGQ